LSLLRRIFCPDGLKEKRSLHREVGISEDPRQNELDLQARNQIIPGSIELLVGIILSYFTLNAFQVLPIWAMESYSPTLIGGLVLAFVALDLLIEGNYIGRVAKAAKLRA
jgi:hypothetical protein